MDNLASEVSWCSDRRYELADCGSGCRPLGGLEDHGGSLFADHDARRVRIAACDGRHDRRIRDAQAVHAIDPQLVVDNRVRALAHRSRADGVKGGGGDVADRPNDIVVSLDRGPRTELAWAKARHGGLLNDPTGEANGLERHDPVTLRGKKVRVDDRRLGRVRGADVNGASAIRTDVGDARGEGREWVELAASRSEAEGLNVVLELGVAKRGSDLA